VIDVSTVVPGGDLDAALGEHRIWHVDPVVTHALGKLEHLFAHLGLLIGVQLHVAHRRL